MGGEQAANVLVTVKQMQLEKKGSQLTTEEINQMKAPILEKYARESSAYYASARLWDDGIISPLNTRATIAESLAATLHRPWDATRFGIFRM
jgi:acetyl-CoA carboxylase carboxyltransferase component